MTEKEKMLNQKMYDANYDKELIEERKKLKNFVFNSIILIPLMMKSKKKL